MNPSKNVTWNAACRDRASCAGQESRREHMKKIVNWLFSGGKKKPATTQELLTMILPVAPAAGQAAATTAEPATTLAAAVREPAPAAQITFGSATSSLFCNSTGEEYEEFLKLLHEGKRPFRKPGQAIRDEYEAWLAHRAKHPVAAGSHRLTA